MTQESPQAVKHDAPGDVPRAWTSTIRTKDGIDLAIYHWPAHGVARATVALVHGLAEHSGRYAPLAERLNAAGIELMSVDLRGHGKSPGRRVWIERFDDYLDDAQALVNFASKRSTPLFLMGHSMGGAIAALYAVERLEPSGAPCAGLILSSAALAPGRDVPKWMLTLSHVISRLMPSFPALKLDESVLSRDPVAVDANRNDPLVYHKPIPARTGAGILGAMTRIANKRAELRLPVFVFHGTADKLTEPEGSREFARDVGSADRTLTLYEGAYHETMNDLDRDRVIDALIAWIVARS
ncbi:lysophospholipase [Pararobbsia silviterrae]